MKWIVYYADGSTFSSEDGEPSRAPRDQVQVVMQENEHGGRDIMALHDHYGWHGDQWIPHDASGIAQYQDDPSIKDKVALSGYWISDKKFWAIHSAAQDDCDWKHLAVRFVRGPVCE